MKNLLLGLALLFAFASCEKERRECPSSSEKTFDLTGFTRISAGETFTVTIKQGAVYSIMAKGCSQELSDLRLAVDQNGTLIIRYDQYKTDRYRVDFEITMPSIRSVSLEGAAKSTISGFALQPEAFKTILSGTATCTVDGLPALVSAELSGASVLNLTGLAPDLIAHLSGTAKLNAYTATFSDADVYTSGTARAQVVVQQSLFAQASGDSRIYYKGNPANVSAEQSGTAKVIHE
jgi:hypothetical protein